jgi:hypothetical protein
MTQFYLRKIMSLHGLARALKSEEVPIVSGTSVWTAGAVWQLRQRLIA